MAFSEEVKRAAFSRAGGRCQCERLACTVHRTLKCDATLTGGRWHAHHKTASSVGGADTLSNCEVLCIPCHENTPSYGRS